MMLHFINIIVKPFAKIHSRPNFMSYQKVYISNSLGEVKGLL